MCKVRQRDVVGSLGRSMARMRFLRIPTRPLGERASVSESRRVPLVPNPRSRFRSRPGGRTFVCAGPDADPRAAGRRKRLPKRRQAGTVPEERWHDRRREGRPPPDVNSHIQSRTLPSSFRSARAPAASGSDTSTRRGLFGPVLPCPTGASPPRAAASVVPTTSYRL